MRPVIHASRCGVRRILLLCSILLLNAHAIAGEDAVAKAQELEALRGQISALQKKLEANQKKKTDAEKRVREIDQRISAVARNLNQLERDLAANHTQLAALREQQTQHTSHLHKQRERLAAEARAAYAMGRQQQVKLLLNQEQPAAVGRMLAYFTYFSLARMQQIEAMRGTLQELEQLQTAVDEKSRQLTELRARQQDEARQLGEQKRSRELALARLSREVRSQGGELDRLRTNEQQLRDLVHSLQDLLADIPPDASQQQPFAALKGKLRWPAAGRLTNRFGTPRSGSGLQWQGVTIAAAEGGKVRAVAKGRVAFADWMRGFGLLLIIDHGDGYMSLYGHNQALYKEVGEWVDSGEAVATLGSSGGQNLAGLYFELRHKGRPVNPVNWFAGKPAPGTG